MDYLDSAKGSLYSFFELSREYSRLFGTSEVGMLGLKPTDLVGYTFYLIS